MKMIMLVLANVLASCAFALTEIVDGITWNYYVKNGYAMLEHPDTRKQTTCPKPVHAGVLPPTLKIPAVLGGCEVRTIGIAAFQIPEDSDVQKIIVPETVKKLACESAF